MEKDKLGGDPGPVPERCPERVPFGAALDIENDAPADTGAQFSLFAGTPKIVSNWTQKCAPKASQIGPETVQDRSGTPSHKESKKDPGQKAKMAAKRSPKSNTLLTLSPFLGSFLADFHIYPTQGYPPRCSER